jgi:hypothetical protein
LAVFLTLGLVGLLTSGACRRDAPAVHIAPQSAGEDGTIRGTVRGPENTTPIDGRIVEVTNVETRERLRVTTNSSGGFSLKLKTGRYRVELPLRDGETLIRQPGVIDLNRGDGGGHADFVIGTVRVSRPRGPTYRTDDGLGSPIA